MRSSRSREDAVLSDEELLDAVGSGDLGNDLNDLRVPVAAVASDDEERVLEMLVSILPHEGIALVDVVRRRRSIVPLAPSGIESRMLATKASL